MTTRPFTYLLITSLFVSVGCKKKETAAPAPSAPVTNPDELTAETPEYVKYQLNGTSFSFTPPAQGTWFNGSGAPILQTGPPLNLANVYVSYYNNNTSVFTLSKSDSTRESGSNASNDLFKNMFVTGSYPYTTSYMEYNKRLGVSLTFKDSQNKIWTSENFNGKTFQSGSVFTISKSISYTKSSFQNIKIKSNFNCKVYNNNDSLQLTNGEVIISFFK